MNEMLNRLGMNAKAAETEMRNLSTNKKNEVLLAVADKLVEDAQTLLSANRLDVETGKRNHMPEGLIDRLLLTESRIEGMAEGLRQVSALDDPVGEASRQRIFPAWQSPCSRRTVKSSRQCAVTAAISSSVAFRNAAFNPEGISVASSNSLRGSMRYSFRPMVGRWIKSCLRPVWCIRPK